jgi:hypothetical protein
MLHQAHFDVKGGESTFAALCTNGSNAGQTSHPTKTLRSLVLTHCGPSGFAAGFGVAVD